MKKTAWRLLALLLAALTLAGCLAGCSGNKGEGSGTGTNGSGTAAKNDSGSKTDDSDLVRVTNVYKSEVLDLKFEEDADYANVSNIYAAGDFVYFVVSYSKETDEAYRTGYSLWRMKSDGTELQKIDIDVPEQVSYYTSDADSGYTYDYVYISDGAAVSDGSLWLCVSSTHSDSSDPENYIYEETVTLTHYGLDGKAAGKIDLSELTADGTFWLSGMAADESRIYLASSEMMYIYDAVSGKQLGTIENGDANLWLSNIIIGGDGKVYAYYNSVNVPVLRSIDPEAFTTSDNIYIGVQEDGTVSYDAHTIMPGFGCTLFYSNGEGINTFDAATGKTGKALNYINSDLNAAYISNVTPINETQMVAVNTDYDSGMAEQSILLLTHVPDEEVTPKRVLTFGTTSLSYDTRRAIINFNKSSDAYRIEVRDYSSYSGTVSVASLASDSLSDSGYDPDAGLKQFNTDIISGNVPDIIQITSDMPYDSYVSKGLFADLYPLLDADADVSRGDYLANVLEALETDGKLYSIAPKFSVMTVIGKTSNVGEGTSWTMSDFMKLVKNLPEDTELFEDMTRRSFMEYALTLSASTYLNYETGECHFDSEAFRDLLEAAKLFPEEIDYATMYGDDFDWAEYEMRYRNDKTLLSMLYLYGFSTVHEQEKAEFGDSVSLVGFPSDDGNGSAIMLTAQFAIYSKSKNTEGAWEFLKYFIQDEYQESDSYSGFPVKLSALTKKMASDIEPDTYEDEDGNIVEIENTWWIGDEEIVIGYATEEEAQRVYDFLGTLHTIYRTDSSLMDIVYEEAGAYFAGQKSAEDVAAVIQNRATIYMAENR